MSAFIIFLIIVNIGYVLYYAAIITMDMNSKGKQAEDNAVTVDVEGIAEIAEEDTSEEETSSPIPESSGDDPYMSSEYLQPEYQEEDDHEESGVIPSDVVEDNPYGLTDEDDTHDETIHEDNEGTQSEAEDNGNDPNQQKSDEQPEPELTFYEPEPSDLVRSINANSEPINIESTMPIQPHMMATTLLKARGLIKEELENDHFDDNEETQESDADNGISYETEVFDKI